MNKQLLVWNVPAQFIQGMSLLYSGSRLTFNSFYSIMKNFHFKLHLVHLPFAHLAMIFVHETHFFFLHVIVYVHNFKLSHLFQCNNFPIYCKNFLLQISQLRWIKIKYLPLNLPVNGPLPILLFPKAQGPQDGQVNSFHSSRERAGLWYWYDRLWWCAVLLSVSHVIEIYNFMNTIFQINDKICSCKKISIF